MLRQFVVGLILSAAMVSARPAAAATAKPENLARKAKASASSQYSPAYAPAGAIDGKIPAPGSDSDPGFAWACRGDQAKQASFTLRWETPVTVAEIIYYGRTAFFMSECWKNYEVYRDGAKQAAAKGQFEMSPYGQRIRLAAPAQLHTIELKFLTSYGGPNPGASEIEVYGQPVPDGLLRNVMWNPSHGGTVSAVSLPPPVEESPELLAKLKSGGLGFDRLVLVERKFIQSSHVYTYHTEGFSAGGAIHVLNVADGKLQKLHDAGQGQIFDCDVSYDVKQILFSWRRSGNQGYQVFVINADGSGLQRLTEGEHHNYNAAWLPDGGIVSCGATYASKKVLGFVDVKEDGSAAFRVPANVPIYFLAMDAQGRAVQRMRSFTHLMPGEVQGCIGCHESRLERPRSAPIPIAVSEGPRDLLPPEWGEAGFDYAAIVQPVLDKHCTSCHHPREKGVIDLSGDKTNVFNVSYESLVRVPGHRYVKWISTLNGQEQNILQIAPRFWGSPASPLAELITSGHPDKEGKPRVNLGDKERRRIFAWIDLNIPYYGTSETSYPGARGSRQIIPAGFEKALADVAALRCAECHKANPADKQSAGPQVPRLPYVRITNPQNNNFLDNQP